MRLITLDLVAVNPKWNPVCFTEADYANDELSRYLTGAGFPDEQWACDLKNESSTSFVDCSCKPYTPCSSQVQ
jgi:hypothetical protein